ncbi:MAG: esterase/lipase family protein, partial [Spirochaetota bacterium]
MLKKITLTLAFAALLVPSSLFAGTECATKYPVVFSHGIGENNKMFGFDGSYFYGVKSAVNNRGCNSYYTNVDCMTSKETKAAQFKAQILSILAVSGASKVNIIGHSDGSLYTRLAISNLGLASKVASHTSICGPHRGSGVADLAAGLIANKGAIGVATSVLTTALDKFYTLIVGDSSSTSSATQAKCLTTAYMTTFNNNVP